MKYLLVLWGFLIPMIGIGQQLKKNEHNPRAVALNRQAIQLPTDDFHSYKGEKTEQFHRRLNIKMLELFDGAIKIEPTFYSVYLNKLGPLVYLKRYNEALASVNKVIDGKQSELFITAYVRRGVIYECYLKQKTKAQESYRRAYQLALDKVTKTQHKIIGDDTRLAFVLMYYKDRKSALSYMDSISQYYKKDPKAMEELKVFGQLINTSPDDLKNRATILSSYSSF